MSAPVMIIRAKGPQDMSLVVSPEVTFFKGTYPRHSNFSWQDLELSQNSGTVQWGSEVSFQLQRAGDLVSQLMLYFTVEPVQAASTGDWTDIAGTGGTSTAITDAASSTSFASKVFVDDLGRAMIEKVTLSIGGYEIEELTGDFMHVWQSLTKGVDKSLAKNAPTCHGGSAGFASETLSQYVDPAAAGFRAGTDSVSVDSAYPLVNRGANKQHIYVPLDFHLASANGNALPMIALQYHDVRIKTKIRPLEAVSRFTKWVNGNMEFKGDTGASKWVTGAGLEAKLVARYIFLDDEERKSFAVNPHNYLITETQHQEFMLESNSLRQSLQLHFSHPVKELISFFRDIKYSASDTNLLLGNYWNFTMDGSDGTPSTQSAMRVGATDRREAVSTMNLSLNQQKLFGDGRDALYFSYLLPAQFHTAVPEGNERVYVIPFAMEPENWKPTGSTNFSRLDTVQLHLDFAAASDNGAYSSLPTGTWHTYGRSHNILKIVSGMGGKRFAS